MTTSRADMIAAQKPKRTPMGRRNVLTVTGLKDTDLFHYHFFKDSGDRLFRCLEAGYEFVKKDGLAVGDATVESARGTDSLLTKGTGGERLFLMRIPMDLYKADQAAKQLEVDALEDETRKQPRADGRYGKVTIAR